ncbi:MAG TPA: hypothetical protein VIK59_09425 [Verrucomicrobiae bacterium]
MKTRFTTYKADQNGAALLLVMILSAIALAILAGVMTWGATSNRLTHRSIQYTRSIAAAEAATEKVESQITRDFLSGGEQLTSLNLNTYRSIVPSSSDSSYWNNWVFDDGNGNLNQTYVQRIPPGTNYIVLDAPYAGLKGSVTTYMVASHASDQASMQDVNGGVLQELELTGIPIFQFAMYSSGNMEISCGKNFDVTGPVHCNGILYIEPDVNYLNFESGVTAVVTNIFSRDTVDGDTRGYPAGNVTYVHPDENISPVQALTLPIGQTNTPEAIRQIIEPPPPGEDAHSALGLLRYYNQCDMILTVSNDGATATSGVFDNRKILIPTNEVNLFVTLTNSFWDGREKKYVQPIDIDIGMLTAWAETNLDLCPVLRGGTNTPSGYVMDSIYIVDARTAPVLPDSNLGAVRVEDGTNLPPNGLTVATGRPLYVWGDYNELNSGYLGTTNTSATRPASFAADAITILSRNWQDSLTVETNAADTTVNAAFLTGVVDTAPPSSSLYTGYSGGMENFPRFLEDWSAAISTYNGSMIKMFPSLYATNPWGGPVEYYKPPARNWTYDANFDDPTQLPPHTPQLLKVIVGQWSTLSPGTNLAAAFP